MKALHRTTLVAIPLALLLAACNEAPPAPAGKTPETAATTQATESGKATAKEAEPAKAEGEKEAKTEPAEEPTGDAKDAPAESPGASTATVAANAPATKDSPTPAATTAPTTEPVAKPTGPVVGQTSTVTASATADAGFKCNPAYPTKFKTAGGSNATYPQATVTGSCTAEKVAGVAIPFIPTAAGPGTVAGTLKYGICDAENCKILSKPVSLAFNASQ